MTLVATSYISAAFVYDWRKRQITENVIVLSMAIYENGKGRAGAGLLYSPVMERPWLSSRLEELAHKGKTKSGLALAMGGKGPARVTELIKGTRKIQDQEYRPMAMYLEWTPEKLAKLDGHSLAMDDDSIDSADQLQIDGNVVELDVRGAAGDGAMGHQEREIARWHFPEPWLRNELRAAPDDLRIITVDGDSGVSDPPRGTDIGPGDKVVVNLADLRPSPPGYFLVWDGIGLVAKRVEFIHQSEPPSIKLISNNAQYESKVLALDDVRIVGRIVGRWQRLG